MPRVSKSRAVLNIDVPLPSAVVKVVDPQDLIGRLFRGFMAP
jgi:hypothetical protein